MKITNDKSFKSAALARINQMESEKSFLESSCRNLQKEIKNLEGRIWILDQIIKSDKESIKDI